MNILITTPVYDDPTHYLKEWSQIIIKEAKNRGIKPIILDGKNVTKVEFEKRVEAQDPKFVFLNGHGDSDNVCGRSDNEVILKSGENDNLMKERIIYTRVCNSLGNLGKKCVERGAKAYIGYSFYFFLLYDPNMISRAREDEVAKPFMEVSNAIPSAIIKGNSVKEALDKSKTQYKKWVEYYKTHYDLNAEHILTFLMYNMAFQNFEGDPDAKIQ